MRVEDLKVGDVYKGPSYGGAWLIIDKYLKKKRMTLIVVLISRTPAGLTYEFEYSPDQELEVLTESEFTLAENES